MGTEAIGWFSSFVLLLTIGKQVHKQWKAGSSEGVSKWLFVGQITASTGFVFYSVLVGNWVFVVTNFLLLLSALTGVVITLKQRHAARRHAPPGGGTPVRSDQARGRA
jgi:MtN3 and saliva related transmembrane protein